MYQECANPRHDIYYNDKIIEWMGHHSISEHTIEIEGIHLEISVDNNLII